MAIKRDYYEILGVPRDASDEEIKRAFRRAAQRNHPDIDTSDGAEERFKELNEAYRVLSDRQRRTAYDMFGHAGVDGASGGGFEGFGGGFGPFGDIFDAFFGGSPAGTRGRRRVVAGADLRYDLTIDFAEAIAGVTTDHQLPDAGDLRRVRRVRRRARHGTGDLPGMQRVGRAAAGQPDDPGPDGEHRGLPALQRRGPHHRHARATTAAATVGCGRSAPCRSRYRPGSTPDSGSRWRARASPGRAAARRATCTWWSPCAITPSCIRRGTELYYELPVTFPQAALGASLAVPTVEGSEEVAVPAGTQSGAELRLRGRGVPKLRGSGRGDLHVIVTVVIPDKLNKSERDLLKQLNEVAAPAVLPKGGGPGLFDRLRDIFN